MIAAAALTALKKFWSPQPYDEPLRMHVRLQRFKIYEDISDWLHSFCCAQHGCFEFGICRIYSLTSVSQANYSSSYCIGSWRMWRSLGGTMAMQSCRPCKARR